MKILNSFLLFCTFMVCSSGIRAQQKKYDLTTPQKFVESLNMIGENPVDSHAVPVFYEKNSASIIQAHDSAVAAAKSSFKAFQDAFKEIFPDKIMALDESYFEIKQNGYVTDNATISFTFSATVIFKQLASYKKDEFTFVSFKPIANGIFLLTVTRNAKNKDLRLVKEDSNYRMKMDDKSLSRMTKMMGLAKDLDKLFSKCTQEIDSGNFTPKNYDRVVMRWITQYNAIIAKTKETK